MLIEPIYDDPASLVSKYGVNNVFRFVQGILLHRKSRQIRKKTYFTSYVRNMFLATILYKYHATHSKLYS